MDANLDEPALDVTQLYRKDASELRILLNTGEVSAVEVMTSFLSRIDATNPSINAICTLIPREEALAIAKNADNQRLQGKELGPLHGLPMACKDLASTKGVRATMGSVVFAKNIPDHDSIFVERLRAAGALIIGKTNTPEFGAGSNTFNEVFGATKNPYNLKKTVGGSSGGAAAALSTRMLPLADGSDMGGSLRNPAAFCNVVGFRPSMGRVPMLSNSLTWQSRLAVEGPMARNVDDLGLLFSVMAGPDPRDPLSITESAVQFANIQSRDFSGTRIAWSPDLGFLNVAKEVRGVCSEFLPVFSELGCEIEHACPDMHEAMTVFRTLRASYYAATYGSLLSEHESVMKSTLVENTKTGLRLTTHDLYQADQSRNDVYQRVVKFFRQYDFLVLPTTQVVPFDYDKEWVTEIEGTPMQDYLEWMSICCVITICDLPAISIPCGFTRQGLPLGIQIVGKPRGDLAVLQLAKSIEALRPFTNQLPQI